jgi:hypothetical protein
MKPARVTRMFWAMAPNEGVRVAMPGDFVEEYDSRVRDEGIAASRRWRWRWRWRERIQYGTVG